MHYLLRAGWNTPLERFEADNEPGFARRWLHVRDGLDAGAWMVTDDGLKIGTLEHTEGRWRGHGFSCCFCNHCRHEFWSRRAEENLCFACLICVQPAVRHRPLRDSWRCDGVGGMAEHERDERGFCWTCRRPWADVLARTERKDCGTTLRDREV